MDSIQVALFFLVSYLLSRVFVLLKIPELIMYYLVEKKHISIQKLTLILLFGTAAISTIIANVITVLTLMPLVVLLQKEFKATAPESRKFNTLFLLAVLWGANIGGIGMVTGTTTNGLLIGFYELYKIPIARDFTFIFWAVWGLPLVAFLGSLAWLILMIVFQPGNLVHKTDFSTQIALSGLSRQLQKTGFTMAIVFIISAALLSYLLSIAKANGWYILVLTLLWSLAFIYLVMVRKWDTESGSRTTLLPIQAVLSDIPKRGLLWMAVAFVITYLLWQSGFHKIMAHELAKWLSMGHSILSLYIIFALLTTFVSELVSNTAVQFMMFLMLFPMAKYNNDLSWQGMLIITLCSACAFMTPLATPSNGLGFGSSAKISFRYMLLAGFIMNVVSAIVIVFWVHTIVPVALNLFF